ncbi:hypothetical protein AB0K09_31975, partial [Streptomyces sp. NPDC049577]|uniref:hypothetical protein n=1 Tax=Streptomyces sp. NPDC049577 TaxID=3155153 RepID=UPI003441A2A8
PDQPPTAGRSASAGTAAAAGAQELALADTGTVDTTPYLFGGVAFVAAGGALVTAAVRRSRTTGGL